MISQLQRYLAPDDQYIGRKNSRDYTIDQEVLAALVGGVALLLPTILILSSSLGIIRFRDTISHYYYSAFFGDLFIIMIAAIGTFLLAYTGESKNETRFATFAGIFAYCIALFPTKGVGIESGEANGRVFSAIENIKLGFVDGKGVTYSFGTNSPNPPVSDHFDMFKLSFMGPDFSLSQFIHGVSTAVLFLFLAIFLLFVFTREKDEHFLDKEKTQLKPTKERRNRVYRRSGFIILGSIVLIAINGMFLEKRELGLFWDQWNATLLLETIALFSFGFAWGVKSKFFGYRVFWLDWRD
ncbi:MAG: hypothetical protein AAF478_00500 [Pseudomonadota bacterium]